MTDPAAIEALARVLYETTNLTGPPWCDLSERDRRAPRERAERFAGALKRLGDELRLFLAERKAYRARLDAGTIKSQKSNLSR